MKIKKTLKWVGIAVAIYFVAMTIYLLGSGKLAIVPSESDAYYSKPRSTPSRGSVIYRPNNPNNPNNTWVDVFGNYIRPFWGWPEPSEDNVLDECGDFGC